MKGKVWCTLGVAEGAARAPRLSWHGHSDGRRLIDPTDAYVQYALSEHEACGVTGRGYAAGDVIGDHDTALCYILDGAHGLAALVAVPLPMPWF